MAYVKTEFFYNVNGEDMKIKARCKSVNDYGAEDLKLFFKDIDTDERLYPNLTKDERSTLEELAVDELLFKKEELSE